MYLISVYFDERTNKNLQQYIDKIAKVTGNNFMIAHKVPPHMTISAIEARTAECLVPSFQSLRGNVKAGTIDVVTVGQMLPYVMYGGVVMNEYLVCLTKIIYDAFKDIPDTSISKYYQPMSWMPHITLGKTLDKEQMVKAFRVMQENFVPFSAEVERIGLARVNPHEDIVSLNLKIFD